MGMQEKSAVNSNTMQRVKIYCLNDDGKWDDQGTGLVTVDYLERASEDLALFVIDTDENETLLMHRIRSEDIYRKQEDSIISWRDPDYATELALSFQEPAGCSYIWEHLSNVQRNLNFSTLNNDTLHSVNSDLRELPVVELSTLPLIHKMFMDSGIADQMRLIELVLHDDFFRKLVEVFKICEDLDNTEGLHMIFRIVKGIILLNSPQIFEKIFGDELIMDIVGSLEYDPDVSQVQHHRDFLKEHVVFKEAIPIKDPTVLSRIHQTYRVGYLKDVVLARVLDDATTSNLNSIIHGNNAVVVSLLKDDNTFIQELFARLRSPTTSSESKKNLVYFLHDFCNLSKSLQMVQQLRLFRDLMNEGIFDILKEALQSEDSRLVLTGTEILILFLNQDPNLLRSYVVRQEGVSLLGLLVKGMITDFGDDMHCQFLEILRNLLDSHTLTGGQRDNIVEIFYEKHLAQLIDVIAASCLPGKSADSAGARNQKNTKPEILSNICELLCFCAVHHPHRTKCNLLHNSFIEKVLLLTHRREKYLVVAAVRFFRTILARHDEQLISHIIRNNLFKPVLNAFVRNGDRYNLLNSAVLDLFEHIKKDNNLKSLVKYIIDSFWKDLVKFEHLSSVQSLKIKFEQSEENPRRRSAVAVSDARRTEERALEKEEEDYFNEDSDEEDTASASAVRTPKVQAQPVLSNGVAAEDSPSLSRRSGGLVDYDDDEDDEEFKTPPKNQPEVIDNDEKTTESLELKRKLLASKDDDQELVKKQRLCKNPKSKDFFAALCSTLGKIPQNATTSTTTTTTSDQNHRENADGENRIPLGGDEIQLVASKSTAEMAVNGS